MYQTINNVEIKSIISVVPKKKVKLDKSKSDQQLLRVSRVIGVEESCKSENMTSVELFEEAAKVIIKKNSLNKKNIKFLICVTQTPDYLMPSCGNIIHQKLMLNEDCVVFDINLGCSGYVYGLYVIMNLIKNSREKSIGLLLVGDTISKTVDKKDKSNSLLFGDAVSATVIENKKKSKNFFLLGSALKGFDKLMLKNSGFNKKKVLAKPEFFMDGKEVFSFAINKVPKLINEIIRKSKIKNIDYYILHQANKMMLNKILDMSKITENKRLFSIKNYGNTSSASIPITISKNLNNKKNKKLSLLAGFGAGFSYAACITDFTKTNILKILKK